MCKCKLRYCCCFVQRYAVAAITALTLGGCASMTMPAMPKKLDIPANDPTFRSRLYVGAAVGNSHLNPDTHNTPAFSVDNTSDRASQLRLGFDVHNMLALEVDTTVLGAASLDNGVATDVEYSAATASALIYGLNGVQQRSRREGWSAYGRLGYGYLKKSSAVVALEDSGAKPVIGVGAEYGFDNGLGIRGELTRLDDDAVFFGLGAVYRFGLTPRQVGAVIARAAEPALASRDVRVAQDGRTMTRPGEFLQDNLATGNSDSREIKPDHYAIFGAPSFASRVWSRTSRPDDADGDGIRNADDQCGNTRHNTTVAKTGCGLFDVVLTEVTFKSGSHWLTPRARGELDKVSVTLLAFPEVPVQVRAHTDSQGSADMNLDLSARRGEAVVHYLQSRGVHELQMQTHGLGEAEPIATNKTRKGRKRNRRIELLTLPNLSPAAFAEGRTETNKVARKTNAAAKTSKATEVVARATVKRPAGVKAGFSREPVFPPISGVRVDPLPTPAYVAGFPLGGVLQGVTFVTGSAELTTRAINVLETVRAELVANPLVHVAVMAHTDDQGNKRANQRLSEDRANSVVKFLVANGIGSSRMIVEGYGETLPLVQNVTAADRERNRRIELRVLK